MIEQARTMPSTDLKPIAFIESPSWTLAPEHTLTKRLIERKLTAETIAHFQIMPNGNGWQYPAANGSRWKNCNSNADPKYSWIGGKPESAEFYHGPDLAQSITAAAGACWLVSGEPDVWALRSAGINHALSGFTEAHAPNDLSYFLASLGVTVLYIAPDLDPAGERWARKIAAALEGSPIELDCRALPADLGVKGDIGKAWQQYNKLMPFERWLTGLSRYYPEPEKIEPIAQYKSEGEHTVIPEDYRLEIIARLGVHSFGTKGFSIKPDGHSQRIACPFHSDQKPSASVHEYKGLYCHSEGAWYSWQKIGQQFNLGTIAEWREARAIATTGQQLTTELREALVKSGATSAARVIDALYSLGWIAGRVFSRSEAERELKGLISSWSVRIALEPESTKDKETIKSKIIYCGFFPPFIFTTDTREKSHNKSKGRPSKLYIMPSIAQIAEKIGSKIGSHNDTITKATIASRADYRAEIYAAPIRRKSGTYSRKVLSERIGITTRTAQTYDKRAALVVTERFNRELYSLEKITELESQPDDKKKRNKWLENGEIYTIGKYKGKPRRFIATTEGAERALASSPTGEIWLVTQLTNHYQAGSAKGSQSIAQLERLPLAQAVNIEPAQPSNQEPEFEELCKYYAQNFTPLSPAIEAMLRDWLDWYYDPAGNGSDKNLGLEINMIDEIGELLAFYRLYFGELDRGVIDLFLHNEKENSLSIAREALQSAKERRASIKNPKAYIQKIIESELRDYQARSEQRQTERHAQRVAQSLSWLNAHLKINKRVRGSSKPAHKCEAAVNQRLANQSRIEAGFEAEYNARRLAEAGNE